MGWGVKKMTNDELDYLFNRMGDLNEREKSSVLSKVFGFAELQLSQKEEIPPRKIFEIIETKIKESAVNGSSNDS